MTHVVFQQQRELIEPGLIGSVWQSMAEQGTSLSNSSQQLDGLQYPKILHPGINCKGYASPSSRKISAAVHFLPLCAGSVSGFLASDIK